MKLLQNISPSGHLLFQSRNDFSILPHLFVLAAPTVSATLYWSGLVTGPTQGSLFLSSTPISWEKSFEACFNYWKNKNLKVIFSEFWVEWISVVWTSLTPAPLLVHCHFTLYSSCWCLFTLTAYKQRLLFLWKSYRKYTVHEKLSGYLQLQICLLRS